MKKYLVPIVIFLIILLLFLFCPRMIWDTYEMRKKLNDCKNIHNTQKKIAIVTLETRPSKMLDIHNKNVREYASLHGYHYIYLDSYENPLDLPIYWKKLQVVQDVLRTGQYDYVMWLDSDTLFIEKQIKIEHLLEERKSIFMGRDAGTEMHLNAGVFIIKNDPIGHSFLQDCFNTYLNRSECRDNEGKPALNGGWSGECYEQGIMNELIKSSYLNYFSLLKEHVVFNSYNPVTSCFILHFYGIWTGGKNREKKMKKIEDVFEEITVYHQKIEKNMEQIQSFFKQVF